MTSQQNKPLLTERHFSVRTLAELWALSEDTITRLFAEVDGVVKLHPTGKRGHRQRITLRIPESIAARVYAEKTR